MTGQAETQELQNTVFDGKYHLGPLLYRDGPVQVCRGWDESLQRTVALHVLLEGTDAEVSRFRERVKTGAELMLAHTVTIFDAGAQQTSAGWIWWAATEFLEDQRPSRFTAAEVQELASQLARTLAQVHALGLAHGDLGPEQVFVLTGGQLRVGGFIGVLNEARLRADLSGYQAVLLDWLARCPLPSSLRRELSELAEQCGSELADFDAVRQALEQTARRSPRAAAPTTAQLPIVQRSGSQQHPVDKQHPAFALDTRRQRQQRRNSAIAVPGFAIVILFGLITAFWGLSALNNQTATALRIPAVVDLPLTSAQAKIAAAGFELGGQRTEPSMTVPAGHVLATDPAAGQKAAEGSFVVLVLSAGKPHVKIPAVAGMPASALQPTLEAAGLDVRITEKDGPDPAGAVLGMAPAAGTSIEAGSTVQLSTASGFQRLPTGLLGKSAKDAVAALHAAGFTARVARSPGFGAPADTVLAVEPRDRAPVKGIVTMSVAAG